MKKSKIYVAGAMSGYENNNFPMFDKFRDAINDQTEYQAVSPADLDRELGYDGTELVTGVDLREVLTKDIHALLQCEAIALTPGWKNSSGARLEAHVAKCLGLTLIEVSLYNFDSDDPTLNMVYIEDSEIPDGIPQVLGENN